MICCLCARTIEPRDVFVRVRIHRLITERETGPPLLLHERMEDGSMEKEACLTCIAEHGAPLELVGANPNGRLDV